MNEQQMISNQLTTSTVTLFSTPVEDLDPALATRKMMWESIGRDSAHRSVSIAAKQG